MQKKLIKVIIILGCWNLVLPYILQTPIPRKELTPEQDKMFSCVIEKYDVRSGGVWWNDGKPYVKWKGKKVFLNTSGC